MQNHYPNAPQTSGKKAETLITHVTDRLGHDRRYVINAEKITRELSYNPKESFETGIRKTLRWYLDNEIWWRGIMDESYRDWEKVQYA